MLQVPLEIAFHNMESSSWAEEEIRRRVHDLETLYDRLISCRVRVDQRATHGNDTIPPVVHIEMGLPGKKDLFVSHEPDRLLQKYQRPDLHNAINEAFRIAERQLVEYKDQIQNRAKEAPHNGENQQLGQIAEIGSGEDFGFLLTNQGSLLYFHRNGVLGGNFDQLKPRDEVYYVEAMGDTGPIASKVRAKQQSWRA